MSVRWRIAGLAAAIFALVTSCSGGSGSNGPQVASISTPASTSAQPQGGEDADDADKALKFAKCMREHGVNMPDPKVGSNGEMQMEINGEGLSPDQMKAAEDACRPLLPNGGKPRAVDAAELDRQRAIAKCLREHGVDVEDPTAADPGIKIQIDGGDKDKVDAAMKECDPDGPGGKGGTRNDSGGGSK